MSLACEATDREDAAAAAAVEKWPPALAITDEAFIAADIAVSKGVSPL
jgi:hypothetical protein